MRLDEGDHEREELERQIEDFGIPEIELEQPGDREGDGCGESAAGHVAGRTVPAADAFAREQSQQDQVRHQGDDASLGPDLDHVVVKMRWPESRGVFAAVERVDLFHVRGSTLR